MKWNHLMLISCVRVAFSWESHLLKPPHLCLRVRCKETSGDTEILSRSGDSGEDALKDNPNPSASAPVFNLAASKAFAEAYESKQRRNMLIAVGSAAIGAGAFGWDRSKPVQAVGILKELASASPPLAEVLRNGKPTVVDFYADWCTNCLEMAPRMQLLERKFKGKVNFVAIDGDNRANERWIDDFKVDGIPHLAFVGADGEVKTALIGLVPKDVLEADMKALLEQKELPYLGYDAFRGRSRNVLSATND